MAIFNGKIHYEWPFSIAMLVITKGYWIPTMVDDVQDQTPQNW